MKYLLMLLAAALLSACGTMSSSETNADSNGQRPTMEQLGRMPLPVGTKLRTSESLIFGIGEGWLGRAVFELPNDANSSYNFFAEQLPRQGWTMIASVRGKKSLLVFTRADRAATIEIDDSGMFSGAWASMTVSPVGSTGGAPSGAGVVVQPLGGVGARRP
jgi:ABC-type amino acid transport substrate-binding protein